MDARNTALHEYLFDVKYMACCGISTRGFDNPFRQDLIQINPAVKYLESQIVEFSQSPECLHRLESM
jgi:hypothetical protein